MTLRTKNRIRHSLIPYEVKDGIWNDHGMNEEEYIDWLLLICRLVREKRYYEKNRDRKRAYNMAYYHREADRLKSQDFYIRKVLRAERAYNDRKAKEHAWLNHIDLPKQQIAQ